MSIALEVTHTEFTDDETLRDKWGEGGEDDEDVDPRPTATGLAMGAGGGGGYMAAK